MQAEEIYWRAVKKATAVSKRNITMFMNGLRGSSGEPGMDIERRYIIREIDDLLKRIKPLKR